MKKKISLMFSRLMSVVTVLSTVVFMILNFENLTYHFSWGFFGIRPTMSLHARYQYWLEDIYGEKRGVEIYRKFRDFTIWMLNHHINLILFAIISLMMLLCVLINKKKHKKMYKILKVYFTICFILMFIATFIAGQEYIDLIYGD